MDLLDLLVVLFYFCFFIWVFYFMLGVFDILKIAILALGIAGIVYYKDDNRVGPAGSILMIVGGIFTFNDFLGWIGAILSIIGGSLYLASLKRFQA